MTFLSKSFVTLVSSAAFRISIIRSKNVFCVFSLPYCHTLMVNYLAQFILRVSQSCYIILTCNEKLSTIWIEKNLKITRKSIILPKANTVPVPVSITWVFKIHANKALRYVDEEAIWYHKKLQAIFIDKASANYAANENFILQRECKYSVMTFS